MEGSLLEPSSLLESDLLFWSPVPVPNVKVTEELDSPVVFVSTPNLIDDAELKFAPDELLTPNVKGEEENDCPAGNASPPVVILAAGFSAPGFGV